MESTANAVLPPPTGESDDEAPDQLKMLISSEVERQLKERGSVLEAMKDQMAKVLAEFEEMAATVNSKRSWTNSVGRTKPFASPKRLPLDIHPLVTPLDIVPPAAVSLPRLPKISGGILKNIQLKRNASGGALSLTNFGGARSPDGKIVFDKILPRVANIDKKADGSQVLLSQQRQQMYERALVRYPQCRSNVFGPSIYDFENSDTNTALLQAPQASLELDFVFGFRSGATTSLSSNHPAAPSASINNSAFYLSSGEILWFTATLVVLYQKETNSQRYFREHTNEVTSVSVHPNQRVVASGQTGRSAFVLVWNSSDEPLGKRFACLKGHQVAVRSISFSHDGKLIASLGGDMYNTICIHDWKTQEQLVSARGHTFRVHTVAFNPFQAYGRPETTRSKKPGQALHDDDVCYTLVSCGVRHIRFWTLTKADCVPPPSKENEDSAFSRSTFGGPPRLRPPTPTGKVWRLEGNVPSFHARFEVQDFTTLAFVNDSPPLCLYDEHSKELIATNTGDHSFGRIVAGTAKGDLCLFLQPRLGPDIQAVLEKDRHKEPAKWWEIPDEYTDAEISELVLEKIAYEPTGALLDIVPHDQETGNRFKLPRQAHAELEGLSKKIAIRPNSNALHSHFDEIQYRGPLAHQGAAYQVAYSRKLNVVMSCGNDGRLLLWKCQMTKPVQIPGVTLKGVFTPLTGSYAEGSHALLPVNDPDKVFHLPILLPGESTASGAPLPKPTSIVWRDDGEFVLVGASNSCLWELDVLSGDWQLLFEARSGAIAACSAHPSHEEVATLSHDGYLCVWNLRQHVCTRRLYLGSYIPASVKSFCMEFHPGGDEIAIGLSSGELLIVDYNAFKVPLRKSVNTNSNSTANLQMGLSSSAPRAIAQVKYCPTGKFLAIGAKDTFVYIYDVIAGYKKLHVCEGHSSAVVALTWNRESDVLQSNAADGEILHWFVSPTKGESKQITDAFLVRDAEWTKWTCVFGWPTPGIWLEESSNLVDIAAVCATGPKTASDQEELVASGTSSDEALVAVACRSNVHLLKYPARRGAKRKVYKAHSSLIPALCFSFDDRYLITVGGDDGTLMQWKVTGAAEKVDTKRKPFRLHDAEDEEQCSSSASPVPPPPQDARQPSQPSPRSRQYRERPVCRDDGGDDYNGLGSERAEDITSQQHGSGDEIDEADRPNHTVAELPVDAPEVPTPTATYRSPMNLADHEPLSVPIQVQATHDYSAGRADELSLQRGEILRVLSKAGGEWWLGETCDGTKGYFPFNFVVEVDLTAVADQE